MDEVIYVASTFIRRRSQSLSHPRTADRDSILWIKERYLSGYELSQVPRFGPDVRSWHDFVVSLVRQLCLDNARMRRQSRSLRAVRDAVEMAGEKNTVLKDPDELLKLLGRIFLGAQAGDATMTEASRILGRCHRD